MGIRGHGSTVKSRILLPRIRDKSKCGGDFYLISCSCIFVPLEDRERLMVEALRKLPERSR